jgi:glycine/D-amino acid oxidase-like deaminating enzyme
MFELDSVMLTRDQISQFLPGLTGTWAGGLFTPSDGRAEPSLATMALAAAVRRKEGQIIEQCAVRGIQTSVGKVSGVITEYVGRACSAGISE